MKTLTDVLERVYVLPDELRGRLALGRRVSLVALVAETGYPDIRTQIDVAAIRAGLHERRAIVENWLRYSADKRDTWGWFFEAERSGTYAVGLKSGFSERTRCEIADPWLACASFIKEELEAILGQPQAARK